MKKLQSIEQLNISMKKVYFRMKRIFHVRSHKFRFALTLFLFSFGCIYLFLQTKSERVKSKYKAYGRSNSTKLVSKEALLDNKRIPEAHATKSETYNFKGKDHRRDVFGKADPTIKVSDQSIVFDKQSFLPKKNFEENWVNLAKFLKSDVKIDQDFLFNISNTGDKLPLQYQRTLKHPTAYPKCGMNPKMQPWSCLSKKVDMLFLIKTSPQNIKFRNFLRTTWGSVSSVRNFKFASVFVVGQPGTDHSNASEENELLLMENQMFGDLLQCQFEDNYRNLPVKVLSSFRWVLTSYVNATYYTITDDDCLMDLVNINAYFRVPRRNDVVYCGFLFDEHSVPYRSDEKNKLYISYETYSSTYFPTFCHGGMYTVRLEMMKELYSMAELTNRNGLHLEDVFITGILREKLGNRNIEPVLTKTNKLLWLMYYPYSEKEQTILSKLSLKWKRFNATLPWSSVDETDSLMTVLKRNVDTDQVKLIISKWKHLVQIRKQIKNSKKSNNYSADLKDESIR